MNLEHVVQVIEARRKELGMSMADVHSLAFPNNPRTTAIQNLKRGIQPTLQTLGNLCEALDIELYIGERRENDLAKVDEDRHAKIPRYDACARAGEGFVNVEGDPVDYLTFPRDWLTKNGISSDHSIIVNAVGQSMEPSIFDGDLVMIDTRKRTIRNGRVFVYNSDNGTRVKRLELVPNTIIVRSDNPDHNRFPMEYFSGDTMNEISRNILGEVVWSGHFWK